MEEIEKLRDEIDVLILAFNNRTAPFESITCYNIKEKIEYVENKKHILRIKEEMFNATISCENKLNMICQALNEEPKYVFCEECHIQLNEYFRLIQYISDLKKSL